MDRVRFGRAIGMGAREAGRALLKAADAATAPNPSAASGASSAAAAPRPTAQESARKVAEAVHQVRAAPAGIKRGSRRFGEAMWGPFVRVSKIVWLEVAGVLFSLFAVTAAIELWKLRGDLHAPGAPRRHLFFAILMLAVFGYFSVSSFLRARRRGR